MANRLSGTRHFDWATISVDGLPARASCRQEVCVDYSMDDPLALRGIDAVVVCGGTRVQEVVTDAIVRWLRSASAAGLHIGATCTGAYALAAAGLLDGYRCSIHWENIGSLANQFPQVNVTRSIYRIDRDRFTCSGGTAPVDMMLQFIKQELGQDVSVRVAEQFIYERIRIADDIQRIPLRHAVGTRSEKLIVSIELMEANIREPISQAELADYVSLSRRQLQRLFQRYVGCTPSRYYLQVRLGRARELLRQTTMSLLEVASLTGFVSSSHFSKSYKEHYGYAPSAERRGDR